MYQLAALLPGLNVAPLAVVLGIVTVAWIVFRGLLDVFGWIPYVWHSALFFGAVWVLFASAAIFWMLDGDLPPDHSAWMILP